MKYIFVTAILSIVAAQGASASTQSRQATITGSLGAYGRCTIEVNVDGAAEVEVSGGERVLRTLSGQGAFWRRFECNARMPRIPFDFSFSLIDGRGTAKLIRDPRSNGGTALVRINDPKGGRERYTFDLQWRHRRRRLAARTTSDAAARTLSSWRFPDVQDDSYLSGLCYKSTQSAGIFARCL